jgi:D-serine deaminase-like pyridoxal phosphate-dependent protein
MRVHDIPTPALLIEAGALEHNLATMAAARPGLSLRPHVKAHKCTALAARQAQHGHVAFTCATPREVIGMAAAGLGADLLLANEVVDERRLADLAALRDTARVTVAVDSDTTIEAAASAGLREVLIDVDIGLPRCGCEPADAGRLAEVARAKGLEVRGVMGYEGHLMGVEDRAERTAKLDTSLALLREAHALVGGDVISGGGTGTYDLHSWITEVQAGSYALMDTAYSRLDLPFRQALTVLATVVSVSPRWTVADAGIKSYAMDHGNPSIEGAQVWFCSDEHITFDPATLGPFQPGDHVRLLPAHVDPTMALHEQAYLVDGEDVVEVWPVDLRGW